MQLPLDISFKIIALAPQMRLTNAQGQLVAYVKQKLFKLKEAVNIHRDEAQTQLAYQIKADRVIDFSAEYHFLAADGRELGSIKRRGMRSLWKASYEIKVQGVTRFVVDEENAWVKVADGVFSQIPLLGMFSGYVFHPAYRVTRAGSSQTTPVARLVKQAAFFEGKFHLEATQPDGSAEALDSQDTERVVLGLLMLLLLEKNRG